ncbi:MAG TPA: ribbon-helix-helix protein, CopG family [Acidobacteriota bacterium]|jgi:hypothetical protein
MNKNRRLEILLSPNDYELLRQKALDQEQSVGELVREAIREKYGGASPESKRAALQRLLRLKLPVADWAKMEREIAQGMMKR